MQWQLFKSTTSDQSASLQHFVSLFTFSSAFKFIIQPKIN